MSNYNNFSKMFHARCEIPNIVRKIIFSYNLLLILMTMGKKMFSINFQSLFDSRSISFGELRQSSRAPITRDPITDLPDEMTTIVLWSADRIYGIHFLFILVFWPLFRNNFPRYVLNKWNVYFEFWKCRINRKLLQ